MAGEGGGVSDKDIVARELRSAAARLGVLLLEDNVELMRPSDILVSVAHVLDEAASRIQEEIGDPT